MAEPDGRRRRVAWVAPGDGAEHITTLPLELRARIASLLPFPQAARLATLSRPWRHIHRHAPVVDLELDDFLIVTVVVREWPRLPSLRSLTLVRVTVEAPFPPSACCPRLKDLFKVCSTMVLSRVDTLLPLLKRLEMYDAYFSSDAGIAVDVDAPELEKLDVGCAAGCASGYRSFTLRAPRLRSLARRELFTECVSINVGRQGSVASGQIRFTWSPGFEECPEMKDFRAPMMRMLQGLLPDLPPEPVLASGF